MLNIRFGAGAVGAGAASCCGSGSTKIMRLRLHNTAFDWRVGLCFTAQAGTDRKPYTISLFCVISMVDTNLGVDVLNTANTAKMVLTINAFRQK
jgi:hypothetical protein